MTKCVYYDVSEMHSHLHDIIREMHLGEYKPDIVVGITRGGLIPATYLSHYFNTELLTLSLSYRDNKAFGDNKEVYESITNSLTKQLEVLIVDDICDSGVTLYNLYTEVTRSIITDKLKSAVLIHNEGENMFVPNYVGKYINKCEDNKWIIFPWENWWSVRSSV